jgi:hypothetical protein
MQAWANLLCLVLPLRTSQWRHVAFWTGSRNKDAVKLS